MKWNFAVELGTVPCIEDDGKLIQDDASLCEHPEIAKYVSSIFSNAFSKYTDVPNTVQKNVHFGGRIQSTVTKNIAKETGIPCVQMEVNGYYRNPEEEEKMLNFVFAMENIIAKYGFSENSI